MIDIKGQVLFKFSVGTKVDFLDAEELEEFVMIEECGNVLPTYELTFTTKDDTIFKLLNEGNDLEVSFGKDRDSLKDVVLFISSLESGRIGNNKRIINIKGMLSYLDYINNPIISISEAKTGIEVLETVVGSHFAKTEFNISKSDDTPMKWVQPNISNKVFANNLWLHSYSANSFYATGITSEGTFVCKDIKADLKRGFGNKYDVKFTQRPKGSKDFTYDGDPVLKSNAGFMNNWYGYGRNKQILTIEDGSEEIFSPELQPMIAQTQKLARRAELEARNSILGLHNENTHPMYWQAYLSNISHLAVFSSIKLHLSVTNRYVPAQILDLAMYVDDEIENDTQSAEYQSGLYYITKLARNISSKQISTLFTLSRESFNAIRGDLK